MRLHNLLQENTEQFKAINLECQQFLEESNDLPLIKWCSTTYSDVKRVKMRKRKRTDGFVRAFNKAFYEQYPSLLNRSIIVNEDARDASDEQFFVFPSDGYKILYSPVVENSRNQYSVTYEDMCDTLNESAAEDMLGDVLKYTYREDSLAEAIESNVEIIIYNIPYFYVVRRNIDYTQILEYVK